MEARCLRVRNWVNWNGENGVVSQILEYEVAFKCGEDALISELKPIPLTEEILLKCGFQLKGIIFRINNGSSNQFDINYSPSRGIFYYDSSKYGIYTEVEIKYLHQLQNLYFALTNEELNVQL